MIKYRLAIEYSAPTYYDYDTNEELYDECQSNQQRLWVVSYDTETNEVEEWIRDFLIGEEDKAREYIKKLEKENK